MMANIVGPDRLTASIGDAVEVLFEPRSADAKVPQFKLAGRLKRCCATKRSLPGQRTPRWAEHPI